MREQREREERQAQKEIQDAQVKLEKELEHYKKAMSELQARLSHLNGDELASVESSIAELQSNIDYAEAE